MNKDCEIVQDLLLGYVDGVLNPESKLLVDKHLEECENCRNKLELIKKDIKENENEKKNTKKIDYLKKIRRKSKIKSLFLLIIFFIVLLSISIHTIRNIIIFKKIDEKQGIYSNIIDNYHIAIYHFSGKQYVVEDTYRKDDTYLSTLTRYNEEGLVKLTFYNSKQDNRMYLDTQTKDGAVKQVYFTDEIAIHSPRSYGVGVYDENFWINGFWSKIRNGVCNGKNCYVIEDFYLPGMIYEGRNLGYIYIDKDSGLPVRGSGGTIISGSEEKTDTIDDYFFEFNTVSAEDVTPPNLDEYEIAETAN